MLLSRLIVLLLITITLIMIPSFVVTLKFFGYSSQNKTQNNFLLNWIETTTIMLALRFALYSYWILIPISLLWLLILEGLISFVSLLYLVKYISKRREKLYDIFQNLKLKKIRLASNSLITFLIVGFGIYCILFLSVLKASEGIAVDNHGFSLLASSIKLGGNYNSLKPFYPNTSWIYPSGTLVMAAIFSMLTGIPTPIVLTFLAFFAFWLSFSILVLIMGMISKQKTVPYWQMPISVAIGFGITRAFAARIKLSSYTTPFGVLFTYLIVAALLRILNSYNHNLECSSTDPNYRKRINGLYEQVLIVAGFTGVFFSAPDNLIPAIIGFFSFVISILPLRGLRNWKNLRTLGFSSGISLLITIPWIFYLRNLLFSDEISQKITQLQNTHTDWAISPSMITMMIRFGGIYCIFLSIFSLLARSDSIERHIPSFTLLWLIWVIDLSSFNFSGKIVFILVGLDISYRSYTWGFATAGTIVPITLSATIGMFSILDRISSMKHQLRTHQEDHSVLQRHKIDEKKQKVVKNLDITLAIILIFMITIPSSNEIRNQLLLHPRHPQIGDYYYDYIGWALDDGHTTRNDILLYEWIKHNTPTDIFILNHPGFSGQLLAGYTERRAVFVRWQTFYVKDTINSSEVDLFTLAFYNPSNLTLVEKIVLEYGITHFVIPTSILIGWGPRISFNSSMYDSSPYLILQHKEGTAAIYKISIS